MLLPINKPAAEAFPSLVGNGGNAAQFAWEEFIYGKIRNPNTRDAYERAIRRFLKHCEQLGRDLPSISPRDVGCYLDGLDLAATTKKLHLSAIRHFFDTLVVRHVVVLNPALSVRTERVQVLEGKTPEISVDQVRKLLRSLDVENIVGLRDRAIVGILIYTAVRNGAIAKLKRQDFVHLGNQCLLRFAEKGGKFREIPVREDLMPILDEYVKVANLESSDKSLPFFRTASGRSNRLTENGMTRNDIYRMVKRRLKKAGLPTHLTPHSFRVSTITDLLSQRVPLDEVQDLAGHADPRTTRLYDRRKRRIRRNIVERISV